MQQQLLRPALQQHNQQPVLDQQQSCSSIAHNSTTYVDTRSCNSKQQDLQQQQQTRSGAWAPSQTP
ncbi:hypothetical protein ENH_00027640 [Eimeria necatrix]|uniref:Uncharacterized protein n=1 Tax=Eimeria necatrix TaxID=51315 RepID=U6MZ00_9EIME|nr:hypothetical protein ENH_00027640 [Eimeria necatrix]CDJ66930.1 hypothetical protein ENH_00027640 [Eimeria necatrix]